MGPRRRRANVDPAKKLGLAGRLEVFRVRFGLTQDDLAEELGFESKSRISGLENAGLNANLGYKQLQRIADKYQVDMRWFFGQITHIKDADLREGPASRPGTVEAFMEQVALLTSQVRELQAKVQPAKDIDLMAREVAVKPWLKRLIAMVYQESPDMVERIIDKIDGFLSGFRAAKAETKKREEKTG